MFRGPRAVGASQVIAAGIGFGFLGTFGKIAFAGGLNVGELLFWRFFVAALVLGGVLALAQPRLFKIGWRDFLICAALGIFGYAVFSTLYFLSIRGVSISLAALLLYTFPVFVTLGGSLFLNETLRPRQWLALPSALIGLIALLWGEISIQSWIAVACGLGASLSYSIYVLASRKWQKTIAPLTSGFYVIVFATVGLFIFHRPPLGRVLEMTSENGGAILGLAILSTIAPMTLFLGGLQRLNAGSAAILSTVEPVTATLLSAVVFGENLGWGHFWGGLGIISAVVLTVSPGRSSRASQ